MSSRNGIILCLFAAGRTCSASDNVQQSSEYLSLMQTRVQERRGGGAQLPLPAATPQTVMEDWLASAVAAASLPVAAPASINIDSSIVGASAAAQVAGAMQQGEDILGVAPAKPQPAGWGPEAALPDPVQPAGWGGTNGVKAYMIAALPSDAAAVDLPATGIQLPAAPFLGLTQEEQLENLLPHAPVRHGTVESISTLSLGSPQVAAQLQQEIASSGSQTPAGWGPGPRTAVVSFMGSQASFTEASTAPPQAPPKPVVLQQESTASQSNSASVSSLATSVALNDDGYRSLVKKGTPEMASFIRRVCNSRDLTVTNDGSLSGFAKFYSGEASSSSFQHLLSELEQTSKLPGGWLEQGRGASAKLNEAGFRGIVAQGTSTEMVGFVRRVIRAHGLSVANEGSLAGIASYYKSQNKLPLTRLVNELDGIAKLPDGWLKRASAPTTGLSAPLDTTGCHSLQDKFKGTREMALFVRRVVESKQMHVVDEGGLQGFADFYTAASAGGYPRMIKEIGDVAAKSGGWVQPGEKKGTALKTSLDEKGCELIQSKYEKGSQEMVVFIRRVAESRLAGIADEGGLEGFSKFYSGQAGKSSYKHMLAELDKIRTLPTGWLKGLGLD